MPAKRSSSREAPPTAKRVKGEGFPLDLAAYKELSIDPFSQAQLTAADKADLIANRDLCRQAIVTITACGSARGYGGHTGGPFDTVPEVILLDAFFRACPDKFVPVMFDEAGHRVGTQYLLAILSGELEAKKALHYREGNAHLPGHPELGHTPGVKFSSGRLGHMWPFVNGVAIANKGKIAICLGSDGSQQEGNDAEAARLAVAQNLNVKLIIDDNDITITGSPSEYLKGYDVGKTLEGHGLTVFRCDGEDFDQLYEAMCKMLQHEGPVCVIAKRKMCPGIKGLEGTAHGHDAIKVSTACEFLSAAGCTEAVDYLKAIVAPKDEATYLGSGEYGSLRQEFGKACAAALNKMSEAQRANYMVIDNDLKGSTGINFIEEQSPDVLFVPSGPMERGNYSAAAGFGFDENKHGIFSTFGAFQEMILSEVTMARLNKCNTLCHFSHCGIDDMADNTCHFGINMFFADNGLEHDPTPTFLYMPADVHQVRKMVGTVLTQKGLRFLFTTRSKTREILSPEGKKLYADDYEFKIGKDDVVREGTAGYIVSYGDTVYRALDAVERLKKEGIDVGLINKSTLNVVDEEMMKKISSTKFVLVCEAFSKTTGLGVRFGTWLLERGLHPKYAYMGTHTEGCGGLWEQYAGQGLDPDSIIAKVKTLA